MPKWNKAQLKISETKDEFIVETENRFQPLQDEAEDMSLDDLWGNVKEIYNSAAEKVLGKCKMKAPSKWMSDGTWRLIVERQEIHQKIQSTKSERIKANYRNEYRMINNRIKKNVKVDKENYYEEKAQIAQNAADMGNMKTVYDVTRELAGGSKKEPTSLRTPDGSHITEQAELARLWTDHFRSVLNQAEPAQLLDFGDSQEEHTLDILDSPPTYIEIFEQLSVLKTGKAPGIDNIPAEFIKCNTESLSNILQILFKKIWHQERIPEDWRKGLIIKLPKKGNLTNPNNWRGITLLPVISKIFLKVIHSRISEKMEEENKIQEEQAGFRAGRSCTDQIFTLRNIIEQCHEWRFLLFINFVDFSKAFDSIHRDTLWKILSTYGIPPKLISMIKIFYNNFKCAVKQQGTDLDWFEVKTGVRQGCVISPFLFIIAVDYLMKKVQSGYTLGLRWNLTTKLNYLAYADDLALFSTTHTGIQNMTNKLSSIAESMGLNINVNKTKMLKAGYHQQDPPKLKVYDQELEYVSDFPYLGAMVTDDGGSDIDIVSRIRKATTAFFKLSKIWNCSSLSHRLKIKIFKSNVISVLLYGSETWKLTDAQLSKLRVFQTTYTRRILKIRWYHRRTNIEILRTTKQEDMGRVLEKRRWKYLGHVLRKRGSAMAVSLGWEPEGRRRPGRPKQTWRRVVLKKLKTTGIRSWNEAAELAKDRERWKQKGDLLCLPLRATRLSAN